MKLTRLNYIFFLFINLYFIGVAFSSTENPKTLQDEGNKNILQYVQTFKETGERNEEILNLALDQLNKSIVLFEKHNNLAEVALSKVKIGNIYRLSNDFDTSYKYYKEAYQLSLDTNHKEYQARALLGMTRVEMFGLRRYGNASTYINKAILLVNETQHTKLYVELLDHKSQVQIYNNEFHAASITLDKALNTAKNIDDDSVLFYLYFTYADLHKQIASTCNVNNYFDYCRKKINISREYYLKSKALASSLKWKTMGKMIDGIIRRLKMDERLIKSNENLEKLHENISESFQPKKESNVIIPENFIPTSNPDIPPDLIKLMGLMIKSQRPSQLLNPRDAYINGSYHTFKGEIEKAIAEYEKAVELLEKDSSNLRNITHSNKFLTDKMQIYYTLIRHLLENKENEKAFNILERSFSRGLRDLIHTSKIRAKSPEEDKLIGLFEKNREKIAKVQFEIFQAKGTLKDVESLRKKLDLYEEEKKALLDLVSPNIPALSTVQKKLKEENYEIIQYLVQDDQLIIWHITKDQITIKPVYLPKSVLTTKVRAIASTTKLTNGEKLPFDEKTSKELFLFLIQPIVKNIESRHLVIIPHNKLHELPFQALINPANGKYLGEEFQISYAPSSTILMNIKRIPSLNGKSLLAIGDTNIASVEREVHEISQLFPNKNKIILEPFKKSKLQAISDKYDILHLSVHGIFDSSKPMLSYLKLNPNDPVNGNLTAAEMFGLPLKPESLVVLSACETKTVSSQANETLGMIRALLYAGAETLILSSWEVDTDSTALWMQEFYKVAHTKPLAEAARQALIKVKSDPRYEHPYYWAAFSMIGK